MKVWMTTLIQAAGALAVGVGVGMLLSTSSPPWFMPTIPTWSYIIIGAALFATGVTTVAATSEFLSSKS